MGKISTAPLSVTCYHLSHNHCRTSCSANVMFNTVKPLFIASERTAKKDGCRKVFELYGENCMKIITTKQIFFRIMTYQSIEINR
jgi:hypothetical protein